MAAAAMLQVRPSMLTRALAEDEHVCVYMRTCMRVLVAHMHAFVRAASPQLTGGGIGAGADHLLLGVCQGDVHKLTKP